MANDLRIVLTEQPDLVLTMDDGFIGSAYSPQIGVEDIDGGHRVTVTYRDAEQGITTKTFDVLDGETGAQGPKGDDGYSPTVSITDTAYGHRVTITDASGEHSYTVPTYASEEAARQSAEDARSRAEGARVQAEDQRAENERQRAAEWVVIKEGAEAATEGAENVNATVTKSGTTATITVTDREGTTHTASVSDGATGPAGQDGTSPTASVQRVEGGAEVTVTDASGTTTAMLYDATIAEGSVTDAMLAPDGIKAQVASLWGNRLTGEVTGEVLTASDAYTVPPLAVGVYGKSEQVTTTGKNLFDPSELKAISGVEDLGDGVYHFPTPLSAISGKRVWTNTGLTGNHVVSYERMHGAASGNGGMRMQAFDKDGVRITYIGSTERKDTWSRASEVLDMTNVAYITCTYNISQDTWWRNLQIEAGSTLTNYEPYSGGKAAPSPDYPQPIWSVEEPSIVTVGGSDLVLTDLEWVQGTRRAASDGIAVGSATTIKSVISAISAVTKGMTYYLHVADGFEMYVLGYEAADSATYYADDSVSWAQDITWTPAGSNFISVCIRRTDGSLIGPNDRTGFTASLSPIAGTTVTLPVTLRGLSDGTRDSATYTYLRPSEREGWAWYSGEVVRMVWVVDLGTLTWTAATDKVGQYFWATLKNRKSPDSTGAMPNAVCSKYAPAPASNVTNGTFGLQTIDRPDGRIFVRDTAYTDADAFKAAMSGVMLHYAPSTPTTETLPEIELPSFFGPSMTIYATADATPTLAVTYEKDVTIAYNALLSAIADIATS